MVKRALLPRAPVVQPFASATGFTPCQLRGCSPKTLSTNPFEALQPRERLSLSARASPAGTCSWGKVVRQVWRSTLPREQNPAPWEGGPTADGRAEPHSARSSGPEQPYATAMGHDMELLFPLAGHRVHVQNDVSA